MNERRGDATGGARPSYDAIEAFMRDYFRCYSEYVNKAEDFDRLDEFYASDFRATGYVENPETGEYPFVHQTRDAFKDFLRRGHANTGETLRPVEISIDERKGKVAAILDMKKENRSTGEKTQLMAIAIYGVGLENGALRLKSLDVCVDKPQANTAAWKRDGGWKRK